MDRTASGDERYGTARLGIVSALLDGDAGLAFHQVLELMSAGVPFDDILFDVLVPIQVDVGRRWALGDYGIGDEHAISAALETVVALLAGSFDQPDDGTHVVVSAAEGESHSLPARVIAAYLTYREFRVTNVGATMPTGELRDFLELHQPEALVLTCSMPANLTGARRSIAAAHSIGVPVVAGGLAFGETNELAMKVGADAWLANPRLLDGLLGRWQPDIAESQARAVRELDQSLAERWADIGAIAEDLAAALATQAATRAPIRLDVELFVQTLDAARLVDDPAPLVNLAAWHAGHVAASGRPPTTGPILDALVTRLASVDPRVEAMVAAASRALD
jgi:methanogenic corrinoid protein MtbC1